jgi:hypothetical protein
MLHSPPQWRGWVSPRELAEQRRDVIPRRVMARLCCVGALNALTRVREQVRMRGSLERGGARSREALALERGGTRSRGPLIGPLQWAAGATAAWAAPCVRV